MAFTITITLSNTIFRVSAAAALVVGPDLLRDQHLLLVETWVAEQATTATTARKKQTTTSTTTITKAQEQYLLLFETWVNNNIDKPAGRWNHLTDKAKGGGGS